VPLRLSPLLASVTIALALTACNGDESSSTTGADTTTGSSIPGNADPTDVEVIDAWVRALDRNDIDAAAGYFAIPSSTLNGIPLEIRTRADARRFNSSLPCGAHLVRADSHAAFTIATFRLSERPGPGSCGSGVGNKAATAFAIEDGKITDWRRVPVPGGGGGAVPAQGEST
jgi:limonene-1,2-epoxide hydrolase